MLRREELRTGASSAGNHKLCLCMVLGQQGPVPSLESKTSADLSVDVMISSRSPFPEAFSETKVTAASVVHSASSIQRFHVQLWHLVRVLTGSNSWSWQQPRTQHPDSLLSAHRRPIFESSPTVLSSCILQEPGICIGNVSV